LNNQNLKNNFLEILEYGKSACSSSGLKPTQKLYVKNKGVQISYLISKILINLGPILIWTQLFNKPMLFYSLLHEPVALLEYSRPQKLGYWMVLVHFFKILFETVAIHRFNKQTMPLMKLIYEMAYTWLLLGLGGGYFLFNPQFQEPFWFQKLGFLDVSVDLLIYLSFLAFELMDFLCHWHLRGLRKDDHDRRYYNPFEYGFGYVTSANYFWQLCAFFIIVLTTQVLYIALFHFLMFVRLNKKA
jgi:very-long-chain enoyl-CoA reductase